MSRECHICGEEVTENYYLDKRGYTCYSCSRKIIEEKLKMNEKRFRTGKGIFEEGYPSETIIDNETGKTYYKGYDYYKSSKEICDLLNEQDATIKQLSHDATVLIQSNTDYRKENEQLKQQINKLQFNKAKGQQAYQKELYE